MNTKRMKTLTIKHEMVESLDSEESKLKFVDTLKSMFQEPEPSTNSGTTKASYDGLNVDLPEPLPGSPEFDSSNMAAAEYKRFSMVRAGFFPVTLNCGYADYAYKHHEDFSRDEMIDMFCDVSSKKSRGKGKRDFIVFFDYIQQVLDWYLMKRKVDDQC